MGMLWVSGVYLIILGVLGAAGVNLIVLAVEQKLMDGLEGME